MTNLTIVPTVSIGYVAARDTNVTAMASTLFNEQYPHTVVSNDTYVISSVATLPEAQETINLYA